TSRRHTRFSGDWSSDVCSSDLRRLHQHRMWVNQRLLDAVRPLTDDQLHQPLAIGQGSVWRTLTHLMAAEYVWLEALLGNESPSRSEERRVGRAGRARAEADE